MAKNTDGGSATLRMLSCSLFGANITLPYPRDWEAPPTEPLELCDIETSRAGFKFFRALRLGPATHREVFLEVNDVSSQWRECWDKKFLYPIDAKLTGVLGLRAFWLLRLYEIGANDGDAVKWLAALRNGEVGWRTLEILRPDLLSVPLLMQWKQGRERCGLPINPEGRQHGFKVNESAQFELDLVAIGEREKSRRQYGKPIPWKRAVVIACERFPELLTGTPGDMREHWQTEMVHRLEKRQTPQARVREIRKRAGGPPVKK